MNATMICYATRPTPLGTALVARSQRGLAAILLGDDEGAMAAELARVYAGTVAREDGDALRTVLDDFGAFLLSPATGFHHRLDLGGTPFQRRVWQALLDIPAGSTITYTDLAARIGRPDAVRAVAGACAANRHAVAVPCHRVLGRDGALSGYRWGMDRKRQLLAMEALDEPVCGRRRDGRTGR